MEHLDSIVVQYIDDFGNTTVVPGSRYVKELGKVVFTTNHFSKFAISENYRKFKDIGDYPWACDHIELLASKGIINGTSEDTFAPSSNIKRADFIVMITKVLGLSASFEDNFSDVNTEKYYYKSVGTAKKLGIANGNGNNEFAPEFLISRQDMMLISQKALSVSVKGFESVDKNSISVFKDCSEISIYAKSGVECMYNLGFVSGYNGYFRPKDCLTRAEAAVVISKINSYTNDKIFFKKVLNNIASLFK